MKSLFYIASLTVVALLLLCSISSSSNSVTATPTKPVPVDMNDLIKTYLIRARSTGSLRVSIVKPADEEQEEVVATMRHGGSTYRVSTGWTFLQLTSRPSSKLSKKQKAQLSAERRRTIPDLKFSVDGSEHYFYGGLLEGYLEAVEARRKESGVPPKYSPCVQKFLDEHFVFLYQKYSQASSPSPNSTSFDQEFWQQQVRLWNQMEGIAKGYNAYTDGKFSNLTARDVYMMNFATGYVDEHCKYLEQQQQQKKNNNKPLHDLVEKKKEKKKAVETIEPGKVTAGAMKDLRRGLARDYGEHCSALVRVTDDDVFLAHDTWTSLGSQLGKRIYKVYSFNEEATVTMTSYPFSIASGEDWYRTSFDLAVYETTNDIFNNSLYALIHPNQCAEFTRVMAANYKAKGAKIWTQYFAYLNDGVYDNQYGVADFKLFSKGMKQHDLPDDFFWIAEQIPGRVESGDLTYYIREHGFFKSYNIPFFRSIYSTSGYEKMYKLDGTFWSWSKYARSEIFSRNATKVQSIEDMQRLMRYNNWKADPFSKIANCTGAINNKCDPENSPMLAIASRGDLVPVYPTEQEMVDHYGVAYPHLVAQGCFGADDSKVSSFSQGMSAWIINGPTNDQVPTFDWGITNPKNPCGGKVPEDTPAVLDFPWILVKPAQDD